jgi:hypothetical protein
MANVGRMLIMVPVDLADVGFDIGRQAQALLDVEQEAREIAAGLKDKWTGEDADAFQAEIVGDVTPKLQELVATVKESVVKVDKAKERILQADQAARSRVEALTQQFSGIRGPAGRF